MLRKLLKDVPYIKLSICQQNYTLPVLFMLYEDMIIAIFGAYHDLFISMIFSKSHNGYITTGISWWANSYDIWYILWYLYFDIWYVTWCVHSCDIRNIPWCVYSYDMHCNIGYVPWWVCIYDIYTLIFVMYPWWIYSYDIHNDIWYVPQWVFIRGESIYRYIDMYWYTSVRRYTIHCFEDTPI